MVAAVNVSYGVSIPLRPVVQEKLPEHHCSSCERNIDKHCDFFNRYVEENYNRCWNHTEYRPQPDLHYVSPPESFFRQKQAEETRKIKEL